MSMNDPLAAVLSKILNYAKISNQEVLLKNNSKTIKKVLDIMKENGYVGAFEEIKDGKAGMLKLHLVGKLNNTGVIKPRFAVKKDQFEKYEKRFLPSRDFGIIIVSTNKGMMTHAEAKSKGIGGKLISYCY